jgi:hypothetical protein
MPFPVNRTLLDLAIVGSVLALLLTALAVSPLHTRVSAEFKARPAASALVTLELGVHS